MATTTVKIGAAPFSMPAIAEFTEPWASGKSVNGIATHVMASSSSDPRSVRSIRVPDPGEHPQDRGTEQDPEQRDEPGTERLEADRHEQEGRPPDRPDGGEEEPIDGRERASMGAVRGRQDPPSHRLNNDQRQSIVK